MMARTPKLRKPVCDACRRHSNQLDHMHGCGKNNFADWIERDGEWYSPEEYECRFEGRSYTSVCQPDWITRWLAAVIAAVVLGLFWWASYTDAQSRKEKPDNTTLTEKCVRLLESK